jgi:hypothetical protein
MKNIIAILALVPTLLFAGETQKICHDQKDSKGKAVQVCKEVKLHKKLDGTKVPPK